MVNVHSLPNPLIIPPTHQIHVTCEDYVSKHNSSNFEW